ncbi:MAG: DUF1810 domain-containing protein [Propionibacteriaceae bacterium]|nr:DUF1810 domain-containing protein [Propionibacteriaceae bacterium]
MTDPRLTRFLTAQEGVYPRALAEVRAGRKRTHWMWFIFPQIAGLGVSPMSQTYAIHDLSEAQAYAADPTLGSRLVEITTALLDLTPDPEVVFGYPDDLKLRSCMTLFSAVPGADPVFQRVLDEWFSSCADEATLRLLG